MNNSNKLFLALVILFQTISAKALLSPGRILLGGSSKEEPKSINAQTSIFDPEKQTKLYELRRLQMTQMDSINEDLTHMEVNLNSLKDMVKTRLDQMHQILDSSLNTNKVFKVTVDNIAN